MQGGGLGTLSVSQRLGYEANVNAPLKEAVSRALANSHNAGRPRYDMTMLPLLPVWRSLRGYRQRCTELELDLRGVGGGYVELELGVGKVIG